MKLCVGAVSRIVVEEAAKLKVPQIVASRRQVDIGGGYTGYDQAGLVDTVERLSDGKTDVVRDHGGPYRNGKKDDDWIASFDADVDAGFDVLHIDVCDILKEDQQEVLRGLLERYARRVRVEVGGERDSQEWLDTLLDTALEYTIPEYTVTCVGGYAHADRQAGYRKPIETVAEITQRYHDKGTHSKAHNMDLMGKRLDYAPVLDAYNVAPEFASVELDAWFRAMSFEDTWFILDRAYESKEWTRWFDPNEGTRYERARCAARYIMNRPDIKFVFDGYMGTVVEEYVRSEVSDAVARG